MKLFFAAAVALCVFFMLSYSAMAGWNTCAGCHNSTLAPDKDKLKAKHKTIENFVKAGLETKNPMMKSIQKDEKALREAAKEIGLQ